MAYRKSAKEREANRIYAANHKAEKVLYDRQYYAANKAVKRERSRRWYEANKEFAADRWRVCAYGVTPERYIAMWVEQDGCCANHGCNVALTMGKRGAFIDHDHACCPGVKSCGQCVRGLLCPACNCAAGYFEDDPARMRGMADYIEAHPLKPKDQMRFDGMA